MKALIRNRDGIQARLSLVLMAFLALALVSVGLMFRGLETQQEDARTINLAGRQRMLVQQMARVARLYEQEGDDRHRADLADASSAFAQTLQALRFGGTLADYTGQTITLRAPSDPKIIAELSALASFWQDYGARVDTLLRTGTGAGDVEAGAAGVLERADVVVQSYETAAQAKIARLRGLQLGSLGAELALAVVCWWLLQVSVIRPVRQLENDARRLGAGDLESPVKMTGPAEVLALGAALEATRQQLGASRRELQAGMNTLEQRVQQRTAELAALAAVSRELSSHLDLGTVLKSVTMKAQQLLGGEVAELCVLDAGQKLLRLHASAGPEPALRQNTCAVDGTLAATVVGDRTPHACAGGPCPGCCEILDSAYRISHVAAPVALGDHVIGALCVGSTKAGAFTPDAVALLTQLAEAAAVALENSRLYEQAERGATLLERQRIAAEMHDGLLQTFSFLRLIVQVTVEHVARGDMGQATNALMKIQRAHEQAQGEIRRVISSLQDDLPVQVTLQEQIAALLTEASGASPAPLLDNHITAPIVLSRPEAEQVLRVVREAVLNAQRHSHAEEIRVSLERVGVRFSVTVADDGRGFDPQAVPSDERSHFGLKIMRARAARLGGELTIESSPGRGTRVVLCWPIEEPHQ